MVKVVAVGAVVLAIIFVVFSSVQNQAPQTQTPAQKNEITLTLDSQNNSGETGTAILSEKDGQIVVTLSMVGSPATVPQPAHIHTGSCPNVGGVVHPLTNVVDGESVTTLNTTLEELKSKLPLGINVHKSAAESKIYTACGDLAF